MRLQAALCAAAAAAWLACGMNPFGPGAQGGLDLYAKLGKNMERPKAINDEDNGKEGSKALVSEGAAAVARLAKRGAGPDPWLVEKGLRTSGDTLIYYEIVAGKPSEEDSEKVMTGRAEVRFAYAGARPAALENMDTAKITDLYSFAFLGRENKTWKYFGDRTNTQLDSLDVEVRFGTTGMADIKPGRTRFRARNISASPELGQGDTAQFTLDSLDDARKVQFGKGVFLDARSGRASDGEPRSFAFDLEIHHKNSLGGNPYLRYQDNEGCMSFMLPWGSGNDSLHFTVHFMPGYERDGLIRKNGKDGRVLVEFHYNEKTGSGTITYKNEAGEIIRQDREGDGD